MPPVDLPRGNAAKPAPPRPASAYRNPAPATVQQSTPARTVVPDARPHGSGTLTRVAAAIARPKAAYANPPAKASSSQPVDHLEKLTPQQRLSRLTAAMTRGAIADPFSPIAANGPVMTEPLKQLIFQGQFNQDFQRLQQSGLLPKGAQEPPLTFVSEGGGAGRLGGLSYEDGSGPSARVFITPQTVNASEDPEGSLRTWGLQTPIHELAHALQAPQVLSNVPLREGGAQAFADAAAVPALGPIAPADDTNYSGYVQMVRRLGPAWFMRKQFQ